MNSAYTYDVITGTSAADYTVHTLTRLATFIIVDVSLNDIVVSLSYDGTTFGDDIPVETTKVPQPLPIACRAFRIADQTPGSHGAYEVTVYYT